MSQFSDLAPRPADALLGLMAAYRADPRTDKIDLGVGVYRDVSGNTPIMAAVRAAEFRLAEESTTKVYEGPQGNTDFTAQIEKLVFGDDSRRGQALTFATPGGTGALGLAMFFLKRTGPSATMWLGKPTWPNHAHVARTAGLQIKEYAYAAPADPGVDFDRMLADLEGAMPGDAVLVQGPCHNPTGIDLDADQWAALGEFCAEKKIIPLIDTAYHGFAASLEEDMAGVRTLLAKVPDALVSYSCSKNFGLYRERCGALMVKCDDDKARDAIRTHLADIARAVYSMPPAHGPAIVATILGDTALKAQWHAELEQMRLRMKELRATLAASLTPRSNSYDPEVLNAQNGMFSQLPFMEGGTDALKERGVYVPGSGRINIAGLLPQDIERGAALLSEYL